MEAKIKQLAQEFLEETIAIRRKIHQFPEIGFEEIETGKTVMEFLDKQGISYQSKVAKTGIVATITGKHPGKTVLLRADMDALEMQEDLNNPLVSQIAGKMHACGHDGHTAGLCLAGAILNQLKDQLHGTVKLMFQPAEEEQGGAKPMIDEGILDGVDAAFGCHLMGHILENHVQYLAGPMMAAPDWFSIKIIGKGGHGGIPQHTIDPIVIAAHITLALQDIVSRMIDPFDPVVISIGKIHAGTAFNVIPNDATLTGTVRTLNEVTRKKVHKRIRKLATAIAEGFDAQIEMEYDYKYPALVNDEKMVEIARKAFSKIVPSENVTALANPMMGGEDFAFIAQQVPSAFLFVGIAKDKDNLIPHHHPSFAWDDHNIYQLGAGLAQVSVDFLHTSQNVLE
jgi:amidohydrolase